MVNLRETPNNFEETQGNCAYNMRGGLWDFDMGSEETDSLVSEAAPEPEPVPTDEGDSCTALFLFEKKDRFLDTQAKYVFLIGYLIIPIIIFTKIPFINNQYLPEIIISILVIIWCNDTFAYLVGITMGKNKLFERISPKKTVEGFVGGVVFAVVAGILLAHFYLHQDLIKWIIIAMIVSAFGTLGDLIESKFKRLAGVKDSGHIMPGHGGFLDRLDSIIFVAPFVYLFYQIIYYVS
jgi:phosphatidate cytidylyltransferase